MGGFGAETFYFQVILYVQGDKDLPLLLFHPEHRGSDPWLPLWTSSWTHRSRHRLLRGEISGGRGQRPWYLHRKGIAVLSHRLLLKLQSQLRHHHSKDPILLRSIQAAMTSKHPSWRCSNKGHSHVVGNADRSGPLATILHLSHRSIDNNDLTISSLDSNLHGTVNSGRARTVDHGAPVPEHDDLPTEDASRTRAMDHGEAAINRITPRVRAKDRSTLLPHRSQCHPSCHIHR